MKNFFKKLFYPKFRQKILNSIINRNFDIRQHEKGLHFDKIINDAKYKNIAIIDASNYYKYLRQRPQHIAGHLASKFDLVLYPTEPDQEFSFILPSLLLCPVLKLKKYENKNIWLFISSHSCKLFPEEYLYLKKLGYKIVYEYLDDFSDEVFARYRRLHDVYKNLEKIDPDIIVTSAKNLYSEMKNKFPNKKVILVENAVNIEDFENTDKSIIPEDMKEIIENKKPIVGYYGSIAPWLDFDLINKLPLVYKNYNFVYLGSKWVDGINQYENVYILKEKKYEELPYYSQHFDCCIIPFKHGDIALKTSPVKFFEHMAQQKPVICTRDLVECRGYEGVFVCEDDEEFINAIPKAIEASKNDDIKQKLLEQAKQNSWKKRTDLIIENIDL